jgi:hypothetical protein
MSARSSLSLRILGLCVVLAVVPCMSAVAGNGGPGGGGGKWWDVDPEPENPSPYYDSILYSEIAPKLREIERNSNRVKVDVIGQSAGGRNLFLVTLSDSQGLGRLGRYQAIRQMMLRDPAKAQEMIDRFGDFKVPVFINASIHGGEYPGVDAAIRLIEALAYGEGEDVEAILENVILLVNVVQNPDGRVWGTRSNGNFFDVGRDFIAQTQPETRATVRILTEWNPMVVLDLHGFVNPMLIEPCTPPHNPNYEYDLYISWALAQAEAMEAELFEQLGYPAQIPYRDDDLGWDDWQPSYAAMYSMYHGAYGHTLETPYRDERGVDALYAAMWGALEFVTQNREGMIHDQIEIFRRGYLDLLQQPIPPELLPVHDQFEDLMIQEFPDAYIIPADEPFQMSSHQAARLVDFLLFNDVQVEKAGETFTHDGVDYPVGTYVVWLSQPKRGLANVILDDGLDLSDIPVLYFYSPPSVWSHPRLWGVDRGVVDDEIEVSTHAIKKADPPRGWLESEAAVAYAYLPTSIAAIQATNDLLARGVTLHRKPDPFTDSGRDFGAGAIILPGDPELAGELVDDYALDVFALEGVPAGAVMMSRQRIAAYGDEGVRHCLTLLGFDFDMVDRSDLNAGAIAGYDAFLNYDLEWSDLNDDGRASFTSWLGAGGDYVGLGYRGHAVDFAVEAGIILVDYGYTPGNAIVQVAFDPDDTVAAGFREDGSVFMSGSVWFNTIGAGTEISARLDTGDFLVSGFWENWQTSGAAGMPIVVHASTGDQDTVLIGFDPTFRGHPEDSFRMVANAIYSGVD